jgi:cytochrome c-type biogenesis protein CcmH
MLLAGIVLGCAAGQGVPLLERRAQDIQKGIMCPVCPGESIDQSQNALAVQMRGIVTEKLEEGWTGKQINAFFVERYGPSVLLDPPRDGLNLMVWIAPPIGLALALGVLYLVLRAMVRSPTAAADGAEDDAGLSEAERDEYFRRVDAAIGYDRDEGAEETTGRSSNSGAGKAN